MCMMWVVLQHVCTDSTPIPTWMLLSREGVIMADPLEQGGCHNGRHTHILVGPNLATHGLEEQDGLQLELVAGHQVH